MGEIEGKQAEVTVASRMVFPERGSGQSVILFFLIPYYMLRICTHMCCVYVYVCEFMCIRFLCMYEAIHNFKRKREKCELR